MIDDEQKCNVKDIVDSRLINRAFNKRLQYKVKWVKHFSNRKWYSVENFDHAIKIIVDYHDCYLNKSNLHLIIIRLIINRIMKINWIKQNMKNAQDLIQKTLNRMKKEMNSTIKSLIFNVDRNFTNIKTVSQDSVVTKQLASKESCLINKEKRVISRFRVTHSVRWSVSERINKGD
jgi:predicted metal-dependent hydrolase